MIIAGAAWTFGNNVSTDEIVPGRYLGAGLEELARHVFESGAPGLAERMRVGDIVVGAANFGTGSSREQAPIALREAGFGAVVAASFARIFYRNCINIGLPVFWSAEAAADVAEGDRLEIDTEAGTIRNATREREYHVTPLPSFVQGIVEAKGLVEYARSRLGQSLVPADGQDGDLNQ